jgi:hypothetical protein
MRFARTVFAAAGVLGLLILLPGFFTIDMVSQLYPPAVTHQDFYYGFLCVTAAWQLVFLVIARDPIRYRPLMPAAMLEKFPYVAMLLILYTHGQLARPQLAAVVIDGTLGILFVSAYTKTRGRICGAPATPPTPPPPPNVHAPRP